MAKDGRKVAFHRKLSFHEIEQVFLNNGLKGSFSPVVKFKLRMCDIYFQWKGGSAVISQFSHSTRCTHAADKKLKFFCWKANFFNVHTVSQNSVAGKGMVDDSWQLLFGQLAASVWTAGSFCLDSWQLLPGQLQLLFGQLAASVWTAGSIFLDSWQLLSGQLAASVWTAGSFFLDSWQLLSGQLTASVWTVGSFCLDSWQLLSGQLAASVWTAGSFCLDSWQLLYGQLVASVWTAGTVNLYAASNSTDNPSAINQVRQKPVRDSSLTYPLLPAFPTPSPLCPLPSRHSKRKDPLSRSNM